MQTTQTAQASIAARTVASRRRAIAITAALVLAAIASTTVGAEPASAGGRVRAVRVAGGLNGPAAFTFTPKGTIVYLERGSGEVRFLNPKTDHDRLFFDIRRVNGEGERGALGVALHPRWPRKPFLYVYVTRARNGRLRNELVRIRERNDRGVGLTTIMSTPASSSPYHNGGRILFGPDRKLYVIVGDGHAPANAQDTSGNLRGKILRLDPDGSKARSNPRIDGRRSRVFAYGIRNSFGFTFDPETRRLWETENGPSCNDEINLIRAGRNYAWGPNQSCPNTNQDGPNRVPPKLVLPNPIGITGAAFCDGCGLGGLREGDLVFSAVNDGLVRRVSLNAARDDVRGGAITMLRAPNGSVLSMEVGPGGRIYFSDFNAIYRLVLRAR